MKVYKKSFKDLFFELGIESIDDLWVLSLFVTLGDKVGTQTTRRFRIEGSDDSEKKQVFITIDVKSLKLDLDLQCLKVIGIIESGHPSQYVNLGEHHSFDLRVGDKLSINKTILLEIQKRILDKAMQKKLNSNVFLVVLDDDSCVIASLNESQYSVITEITFKGSGKRDPGLKESSRQNYFDSIIKVISSSEVDNIIVGGPGFEKENLQKYLYSKFTDKKFLSKFTFTQAASPGISGIKELVKGGAVKRILSDLNVQKDSDLIDDFLLYLSRDKPVTYGLIQIKESLERGQLKLVLISDKFFHENFSEIKNLLLLLEDNKIEYHIVNSNAEPGRILDNMTGIAAFLYY